MKLIDDPETYYAAPEWAALELWAVSGHNLESLTKGMLQQFQSMSYSEAESIAAKALAHYKES